ncbi:uncharacterized protein LOC113665453 isoform X3 [Pocillopora damicornis]|uniref:uncharacterized protein LOC113665453 isoform X3 n=1 Tax=Pocillopora damicornis TaxID=46731 RepID=UPI000F54CA26|nr:uncharacterized protein LOC113665453 isoform X3 [Pocillopora damicornis]
MGISTKAPCKTTRSMDTVSLHAKMERDSKEMWMSKSDQEEVTGEERGREVKILLFGRRVCCRAFSFAFLFLFNSLKGYFVDDHFIGETPADNLAVASATDHESNSALKQAGSNVSHRELQPLASTDGPEERLRDT